MKYNKTNFKRLLEKENEIREKKKLEGHKTIRGYRLEGGNTGVLVGYYWSAGIIMSANGMEKTPISHFEGVKHWFKKEAFDTIGSQIVESFYCTIQEEETRYFLIAREREFKREEILFEDSFQIVTKEV
jgi:hypothetical protein